MAALKAILKHGGGAIVGFIFGACVAVIGLEEQKRAPEGGEAAPEVAEQAEDDARADAAEAATADASELRRVPAGTPGCPTEDLLTQVQDAAAAGDREAVRALETEGKCFGMRDDLDLVPMEHRSAEDRSRVVVLDESGDPIGQLWTLRSKLEPSATFDAATDEPRGDGQEAAEEVVSEASAPPEPEPSPEPKAPAPPPWEALDVATAKQFCQLEWPDDYRMQSHCVGEHRKSRRSLERFWANHVQKGDARDAMQRIGEKCVSQWAERDGAGTTYLDWRMAAYCAGEQFKAYQQMQGNG